jgi:hypothetical protein
MTWWPKQITPSVSSRLALLVIGLPLVYVLSIGPTALVLSKTHPSGTAMQGITIFYKPLDWLHDRTFMRDPLEYYVKCWTGK